MVRKLYTDFIRGAAAFDAVTLMQGVSYARDLAYHKEMIGYSGEERFGFRYLPVIGCPDEDADHISSLSSGSVNDLVRHLFDEEKLGQVDPILGEGVAAGEILDKIAPEETTIYVCGHPGMIEAVSQVTERHGYTDILKEVYG